MNHPRLGPPRLVPGHSEDRGGHGYVEPVVEGNLHSVKQFTIFGASWLEGKGCVLAQVLELKCFNNAFKANVRKTMQVWNKHGRRLQRSLLD